MAGFDKFYEHIGFWSSIVYIAFGSIALLCGITISVTNIRFKRMVETISASYFFGVVAFSVGSISYGGLVHTKGDLATSLFWSIIITACFVSLVSGALILCVRSLRNFGSIMIGLASGFSAMNLFYRIVPSEIILLICSVALAIIIGCMSLVFDEPFHIIIIPCTGFNLILTGTMALLNGILANFKIATGTKENILNIVSYTLFGVCLILLVIVSFLHYRKYILKREQLELDHKLVPTPNPSIHSPQSEPTLVSSPPIKIDITPSNSDINVNLSSSSSTPKQYHEHSPRIHSKLRGDTRPVSSSPLSMELKIEPDSESIPLDNPIYPPHHRVPIHSRPLPATPPSHSRRSLYSDPLP